MNLFSSEADQVFLGDVVTMADEVLGFFGLTGEEESDPEIESVRGGGRLGGISVVCYCC